MGQQYSKFKNDDAHSLSLVGGPAQRVQVAAMNDGHDHDDIGWGTSAESSGGIE